MGKNSKKKKTVGAVGMVVVFGIVVWLYGTASYGLEVQLSAGNNVTQNIPDDTDQSKQDDIAVGDASNIKLSWTSYSTAQGLAGNSVSCVRVDGQTIYAATDGGLSISKDGGNSWKTLLEGVVHGVFTRNFEIYAATDDGLKISLKAGAPGSWSSYLEGKVVRAVRVSNKIYAATDGGLSVSADGGKSWKNYTDTDPEGLASSVVNGVAAVDENIYAATGGGLSISKDAGNTWQTVNKHGLASVYTNCVYLSGTAIYVATKEGLSISRDYGDTWTKYTTNSGLASNFVYSVYASGVAIYAATARGLSISTDDGVTWVSIRPPQLADEMVLGVYPSYSEIGLISILAATSNGLSIGRLQQAEADNFGAGVVTGVVIGGTVATVLAGLTVGGVVYCYMHHQQHRAGAGGVRAGGYQPLPDAETGTAGGTSSHFLKQQPTVNKLIPPTITPDQSDQSSVAMSPQPRTDALRTLPTVPSTAASSASPNKLADAAPKPSVANTTQLQSTDDPAPAPKRRLSGSSKAEALSNPAASATSSALSGATPQPGVDGRQHLPDDVVRTAGGSQVPIYLHTPTPGSTPRTPQSTSAQSNQLADITSQHPLESNVDAQTLPTVPPAAASSALSSRSGVTPQPSEPKAVTLPKPTDDPAPASEGPLNGGGKVLSQTIN